MSIHGLELTLPEWFALIAVGSLILPTVVYQWCRRVRPVPRPRAARLAAWWCLWVGQLALPVGTVAGLCGSLAWSWWHDHVYLVALVYGGAMMLVATMVVALAVRSCALGPLLLAGGADSVVAEQAAKLARRAGRGCMIVIGYVLLETHYLPIPGRWMDLIYLALVMIPVGLGALLVLLVSSVVRYTPWVARHREA